jgi:hypothetical protein
MPTNTEGSSMILRCECGLWPRRPSGFGTEAGGRTLCIGLAGPRRTRADPAFSLAGFGRRQLGHTMRSVARYSYVKESVRALAKRCGISPTTIQNGASGRRRPMPGWDRKSRVRPF